MKMFWFTVFLVVFVFSVGLFLFGDKANAAFLMALAAIYYGYYLGEKIEKG